MKEGRHPKSENVMKVIRNFEKVLPYANEKFSLEMSEGDVCGASGKEICGTTQCHGGWYAVAVFTAKDRANKLIDYLHGAKKMAKDLGFKDGDNGDVEDWASSNPKIWGNTLGACMFSDEKAFRSQTKRKRGAKSLQDIVDHWKEVYNRLRKLEGKDEEKWPDMTEKLAVLPTDEVSDLGVKEVKEVKSAEMV